MAWLNPLNLIKLFSLLKSLFDGVMAIYKAYKDRKEEQAAKVEAEKSATEAIAELQTPVNQTAPNTEEVPSVEKWADYFKHRRNRKRP